MLVPAVVAVILFALVCVAEMLRPVIADAKIKRKAKKFQKKKKSTQDKELN